MSFLGSRRRFGAEEFPRFPSPRPRSFALVLLLPRLLAPTLYTYRVRETSKNRHKHQYDIFRVPEPGKRWSIYDELVRKRKT
ncbi:unnamed protein product, partial [Nesidiocoris tenuis]